MLSHLKRPAHRSGSFQHPRPGTNSLNKIRALAAFSPDALFFHCICQPENLSWFDHCRQCRVGLCLADWVGDHWIVDHRRTFLLFKPFTDIQPVVDHTLSRAQNLGTLPGLVAAAALLVDYILNAAVSLTAGVAAVASAFPGLWPYRVALSLILLAVITVINLRGLRETGT